MKRRSSTWLAVLAGVVLLGTSRLPAAGLRHRFLAVDESRGQLVWQWHDPARAGSINGVIILDDLDPAVLNEDASSVLRPVRRAG